MKQYTKKQVEKAIALINSEVDRNVEYLESHPDAGDSYSHLLHETGGKYSQDEFREWCKGHGVLGTDNQLYDMAVDISEMRSGAVDQPWDDLFILDSYNPQEFETDLNYLVESGQIEWGLLMHVADRCEAHITGTGYAYCPSQYEWHAVVDCENLREYGCELVAKMYHLQRGV